MSTINFKEKLYSHNSFCFWFLCALFHITMFLNNLIQIEFFSSQTSKKRLTKSRKYVQRLSYWQSLNFADSFCCFRLKLKPIFSQWHVKQWLQHLTCATSFYTVGDDSLFKFGLKNRLSYKVFTLCDKFSYFQMLSRTMNFRCLLTV